jgi:2,4-dienoyl-CoA reductase-like NADH-dependent reductase (Old Yellow Enzyme family)
MSAPRYARVASLKTPDAFTAHLAACNARLPFDADVETGPSAPLAQPLEAATLRAGNRFAILPMEGWDGTSDGRPSELTIRRWTHFGLSGAKLIWGGEAVAVRPDGRANPRQLVIADHTLADLERLRTMLLAAHREHVGTTEDLVVGLQLTHSGRYARPDDAGPRPRIAYRHPLLDARLGITSDDVCFSDRELDELVADFVTAGRRAASAGFDFVDIKHCHGYLGHELLSAYDRPGAYGGSLEHRTRFLRAIVEGLQAAAPALGIGIRISAFDTVPYRQSATGEGEPAVGDEQYRWAFGLSPAGGPGNTSDCDALLSVVRDLGVRWVCLTAGSPYYNPHVQRPALFPPSDGYLPPEDPLVGVARHIQATAALKARHPDLAIVGSGYSYLQEWLPHVAQHVVRTGMADSVGIGRMVLSYPEFVRDVLEGRPLRRNRLCRTFSDCTTGPRNGLVSGCYPLDAFYVAHPDAARLRDVKGGAVVRPV